MTTETVPVAVRVGELLDGPCPVPAPYINNFQHWFKCNGGCKGTGKVSPLREPHECRYAKLEGVYSGPCQNDGHERGWTPIVDYAAVKAAVQAKGWRLIIETDLLADCVTVYHLGPVPEDEDSIRIARLDWTRGIKDMEAIFTTVLLAVEKEAGG